MTVGDALRIAGGAGGVTHGGGAALVGLDPIERGFLRANRLVIIACCGAGERFGKCGVIGVADNEEVLDVRQRARDPAEQRDERCVDDDDAIVGVVDHVGQLLGEQADVQGVEHGAHRRDGQVRLQMLGVVPAKCGDALISRDAQPAKGVGEPGGVGRDIAVRGASHRQLTGVGVVVRQCTYG